MCAGGRRHGRLPGARRKLFDQHPRPAAVGRVCGAGGLRHHRQEPVCPDPPARSNARALHGPLRDHSRDHVRHGDCDAVRTRLPPPAAPNPLCPAPANVAGHPCTEPARKRPPEALTGRVVERLISDDERRPEPWIGMARIVASKGDHQQALQIVEKVCGACPDPVRLFQDTRVLTRGRVRQAPVMHTCCRIRQWTWIRTMRTATTWPVHCKACKPRAMGKSAARR